MSATSYVVQLAVEDLSEHFQGLSEISGVTLAVKRYVFGRRILKCGASSVR